MRHRLFLILLIVLSLTDFVKTDAQTFTGAKLVHFNSSHTSFPDTGRALGHIYDSVLYNEKSHYGDNTVLMIIPDNLKIHKSIDMVFWFHGWRNHVDSAAVRYGLIKQFISCKRNAVLILAETARDAPDSYGGKLEQKDVFKDLVDDVMNELKNKNIIHKKTITGNITLAGHSGAFRVIARILENGGMEIKETDLFDALYGETEKFMNWIKENSDHRFINWYTNMGGGTDEVSEDMMKELQTEKIDFIMREEDSLNDTISNRERIIFIHSKREHNDIINDPDNFELLLENNPFLKP